MNLIKFPVFSPCCAGARIGQKEYEGYRLYGCLGCGKVMPRATAVREIRAAKRSLKYNVDQMYNNGHWTDGISNT